MPRGHRVNSLTTEEDLFEALLEGREEHAPLELARMAKLVQALDVQPSGMRQGFWMDLRTQILAEGATVDEADVFNVILEEADFVAGPTPLARMATLARAVPVQQVPMRAGFRAELRQRIIDEADKPVSLLDRIRARADQARDRARVRNASLRRSLRTVVAVAAATMVLGGAGAVFAAAEGAVWGDVLHPVDRFREQAGLAFTFGDAAKGRRLLEIGRERTLELYALTDRGVSAGGPFIATLDLLDSATVGAATHLVQAFRGGEGGDLIRDLQRFADQQKLDLSGLVDRLPPSARPAVLDSIALIDRVREQTADILRGCPCPSNPLEPPSVAPSAEQPGRSVSCACETGTGGGFTGTTDGNGGNGGGPGPNPSPTPTDSPSPTPSPSILPTTGVVPVDDTVDEFEDLIGSILPTPLPTAPSSSGLP